ncbi:MULTISPECIES: hypothetical protein [Limnospira]|uniref:hypothetical protein n=1 Tax=Limnospira TaxID=2596745 RepID=UPI0002804759|nr:MULTISPECIES: hypothetical protein [Limnospira]EKD10447.1 hypothetical protein SPLC1_S081210 [Arthrospira platensis C1]QJB24434.1 hypothetical protein HFV01_23800 [Limnospira fusiformis SAG 85.79]QNH58416.1 MAG: hypothetical protein H2674_03425 [Limnospira indica BM01]
MTLNQKYPLLDYQTILCLSRLENCPIEIGMIESGSPFLLINAASQLWFPMVTAI